MEILTAIQENWDVILASLTAAVIGADKVMLIVITTMGNIRDTWQKTFPKVYKIEDLEIDKNHVEYSPPGTVHQARKG